MGIWVVGNHPIHIEGCDFASVDDGIVADVSGSVIVSVSDSRFSKCSQAIQLRGEGIFTVSHCVIQGSHDGIRMENGSGNSQSLVIESTVFSKNGPAIYADHSNEGIIVIKDSSFLENFGGIETFSDLVVIDSIFTGNHDALVAFAGLEISGSRFSRNKGNHVVRFGDSGVAEIRESNFTNNDVNDPHIFSTLPLTIVDSLIAADQEAIEAEAVWIENSTVRSEDTVAIRVNSQQNDEVENRIKSSLVSGDPAIEANNVEDMEILSSRIRGHVSMGSGAVVRDSFFPDQQGQLQLEDRAIVEDSFGLRTDLQAGPDSSISRNSFESYDIQDLSRVIGNRSEYDLSVGPYSEIIGNRVQNGWMNVEFGSSVRENHVLRFDARGGDVLAEHNFVYDGEAIFSGGRNTIRWNTFDFLSLSVPGNLVISNSASGIDGETPSPLFGPIVEDEPGEADADHPHANFILD